MWEGPALWGWFHSWICALELHKKTGWMTREEDGGSKMHPITHYRKWMSSSRIILMTNCSKWVEGYRIHLPVGRRWMIPHCILIIAIIIIKIIKTIDRGWMVLECIPWLTREKMDDSRMYPMTNCRKMMDGSRIYSVNNCIKNTVDPRICPMTE